MEIGHGEAGRAGTGRGFGKVAGKRNVVGGMAGNWGKEWSCEMRQVAGMEGNRVLREMVAG